jgi:hypothetical protein
MQNVINKYGFYCNAEILEVVDQNNLLEREKYYIQKLDPIYNTIKDPTTQLNNSATSKKIYQYTLQGNYLAEWESINSVERNLDIQVSPALDKNNRSAGGYQWRTYKKDIICRYTASQGHTHEIYVYDILGNYMETLTMRDIQARYYPKLSITQVRNRINNQCKTSKSINKLRFSKAYTDRLDNNINTAHAKGYIILQYDLKMNYIDAHDSIESAQKKLGVTSIYDNLIGKTKTVNKQYKFKVLNGSLIQ